MSIPTPRKAVLESGLSILTVTRRDIPLVAVLLTYRAGSLFEPAGKTGLAHLTEHMMFRGTPSRPQGEIDRLTGRLGGTNNAMTTADHALYYFILPSEHWWTAVAIEADRMFHCEMTEAAFATERRVAIEERRMLDDDPEALAYETIDALAFGDHPYRYPVVGVAEDLERLTLEDVRSFYAARYAPDTAVLSVVGDVEHDVVVATAEELFVDGVRGDAAERARAARHLSEGDSVRAGGREVVTHPSLTPRVVLAFHTPEATHPDTPALELLATLLSSGRSSRLYRRLVAGRGSATEVSASKLLQTDPGLFYVGATLCPGASAEECEREMDSVIEEVVRAGVGDDELERARNLSNVDLLLSRETRLGLAGTVGFWESLGDWGLGEEYEERLAGVNAEELRRVAETYLAAERSTVWLVP